MKKKNEKGDKSILMGDQLLQGTGIPSLGNFGETFSNITQNIPLSYERPKNL